VSISRDETLELRLKANGTELSHGDMYAYS
jgi:hypothetical protein